MRWTTTFIFPMMLLIACNKSDEEDLIFQNPPPDYVLRLLKYFDESGNQIREIRFDYDTDGNWIDSGNIYNNAGHLVESAWPGPWQRPYSVLYHYNEFDLIDTIKGLIPGHEQQVVFNYRIRKLEDIIVAIGGRFAHSFILDRQREDGITVTEKDARGMIMDSSYTYLFDNGKLPFPKSYILKNNWYPVNISDLISDHNLLKVIVNSGENTETVKSFRYEYDDYGFPLIQYASDGSKVTFTYQ